VLHFVVSKVIRDVGERLSISVTFWKLNPNVSPEGVTKLTVRLMEKTAYPPAGVKILGFYICPGGKGVTIGDSETASSETAFKNWLTWIQERKDLFECYEVMPTVSAEAAVKMALGK
jgi:hypothetical protein